jgi:hypothetical protein
MFDERTRRYLRAVRLAAPATIAPWRTNYCPECGDEVAGGGLILSGAEDERPHVLIRGIVVLGCEGYPIISPAALGLDPGQWEDWRGSRDAAYINDNGPGHGYQVTLSGEYVGAVAATYPQALTQLRTAFADLPRVAGAADPDIYYAARSRDLIVKFPCPLAEVRQDFDRPPRLDDQLWWASLPPHIGVEAMCLLCGQTFNPCGPDDLTHGVTLADDPLTGQDEPCGGPGVLLGAWGAPVTPGKTSLIGPVTPVTADSLGRFGPADADALVGHLADITEYGDDELETTVTYEGAYVTGVIPRHKCLVITGGAQVIRDARTGEVLARRPPHNGPLNIGLVWICQVDNVRSTAGSN